MRHICKKLPSSFFRFIEGAGHFIESLRKKPDFVIKINRNVLVIAAFL